MKTTLFLAALGAMISCTPVQFSTKDASEKPCKKRVMYGPKKGRGNYSPLNNY
jgi:hypothetical protein